MKDCIKDKIVVEISAVREAVKEKCDRIMELLESEGGGDGRE